MQSYSHIELVIKEIQIVYSATSGKRKYTPMKEVNSKIITLDSLTILILPRSKQEM
jgi:hypothetical protein